jgi:RNA polymerase sigma-70 factor, ECF subfamily
VPILEAVSMAQTKSGPGTYQVLINQDRQLVAWPSAAPIPSGWRPAGASGSQAECVAYIDGHWTGEGNTAPPRDFSGDSRLVQQLRDGDESAFAGLIDQFHLSFVRLAQGFVHDHSLAEDVAQEAWIGILRGLHQYAGRASFKSWMFRILVNCAKRRARRESHSIPFSAVWDEADDRWESAVPAEWFRSNGDPFPGGWVMFPRAWGDAPEERLMSQEIMTQLGTEIDRLPLKQREVLVLRDVEGLSPDEVCNALQLSESNQRVLLHRARSRLRQALAVRL